MEHVAVFGVGKPVDSTNLDPGRGELAVAERLLDAVLHDVGKLGAADSEELDAVVGRRVVGGRDHDAEVCPDVADQVGRGRSRDDPGVQHVDARTRQPCRNRGRDELARDSRVTGDNGDRTPTGCPPTVGELTLAEYDSSSLSQPEGKLDRDVPISETTNPVGSEQARHYSCNQLLRVA